jgi:dipeptidyl aminopeptidase/acylaminoacyl peptidase
VVTKFHDLDEYVTLPRLGGLVASPDGTWLAASVQTLAADRKKFASAIWRIDATGGLARRLTRSAEGEGGPRFLPDGSLLFISRRPAPDRENDESGKPALWLLPAGGGEARLVATLPGGIAAVEAGAGGQVVVAAPVLDATSAAAEDGETAATADARLRQGREKAGVSAILHESGPVRFWDADLGPDDLRLFAIGEAAVLDGPVGPGSGPGEAGANAGEPRDLTPDVAHSFIEQTFAVSPDGALVATNWYRWLGSTWQADLLMIDIATGQRRVLLSDPEADYSGPAFAPDGKSLVAARYRHATADKAADVRLVHLDLGAGGAERDLLPGFDRRPADPRWDPEGRFIYFVADDQGRRPVYRAEVSTGQVTRVTSDDGHYGELSLSPDGTLLYALRDTVAEPPTPVRIDAVTGAFERLPAPGQLPEVTGRLEEVEVVADDGQPIRSWLVLPEGASAQQPAPLLLWVHGGPESSWNSWQWRWNPWLMAARGYAVLLPDPALSTGYGLDFIQRGHRVWGTRAFADLIAATDAVVARDDIDGSRTAMMGGSYGGYMANWIAGHTDRFKAIVTHASLWALDQMMATTDVPADFYAQFGEPGLVESNTPHTSVEKITTPMLVIHGDKDYRVPVGEALRLWWDLQLHGKTAKFLYFPDEGHWIVKPGNVKAWYETVLAFLDQHVLGGPWRRPDLL